MPFKCAIPCAKISRSLDILSGKNSNQVWTLFLRYLLKHIASNSLLLFVNKKPPSLYFFWSKKYWWWEQCQMTQHSTATTMWTHWETHALGTVQESRPDKWEAPGSTWPYEWCKQAGLLSPPISPLPRGYQQLGSTRRVGNKGNRRRSWQPCLLPSINCLPALEVSSRKLALGQKKQKNKQKKKMVSDIFYY